MNSLIAKILNPEISLNKNLLFRLYQILEKLAIPSLLIILSVISIYYFDYYYSNGLALAYNDARSHLDIGRRVVEGLKPGIAQLGSVWLPLPHVLMLPFIWNDFLWHTGLAGALNSMASFVITGILIYAILKNLQVGLLGRILGVALFTFNINVLYLQSTAMTELLLIATTTAAVYYLILWSQKRQMLNLIKCAFWVMMSTLNRYDGWFLFAFINILIVAQVFLQANQADKWFTKDNLIRNFKQAEGIVVLFCTLAGFGIFLWFLWNLLIFGDPLFFAFGPYSAHAQQTQLETAGNLITKHNWWLSTKTYFYALFFNINTFIALVGFAGSFMFWLDKRIPLNVRISAAALFAPLLFNIIALYLGHSVLFIQGINGDTWFNVRYGIMLIPTIAIFAAYFIDRLKNLRIVLIGFLVLVIYFGFVSNDAVTIDDARVGSSQKNVREVSDYLKQDATNQEGFVLISAASHDAIIFSSGMPMKRFIHEGTGAYWKSATVSPDRWARWIIMRTHDDNDSTWRFVKTTDGFAKYELIATYPFADVYKLRDEYLGELNTKPILPKEK